MEYITDHSKGWITYGDDIWRSTIVAVKRLKDKEIHQTGVFTRAVVFHLTDGTTIAVVRYHSSTKLYSIRMEGFEFWKHNRVLGYAHFCTVESATTFTKARKFIEAVIKQAKDYSE